jgi:hypothetical protein
MNINKRSIVLLSFVCLLGSHTSFGAYISKPMMDLKTKQLESKINFFRISTTDELDQAATKLTKIEFEIILKIIQDDNNNIFDTWSSKQLDNFIKYFLNEIPASFRLDFVSKKETEQFCEGRGIIEDKKEAALAREGNNQTNHN